MLHIKIIHVLNIVKNPFIPSPPFIPSLLHTLPCIPSPPFIPSPLHSPPAFHPPAFHSSIHSLPPIIPSPCLPFPLPSPAPIYSLSPLFPPPIHSFPPCLPTSTDLPVRIFFLEIHSADLFPLLGMNLLCCQMSSLYMYHTHLPLTLSNLDQVLCTESKYCFLII